MENMFQIIGLKAPGISSDQFWFNKILVLLCERPKPTIVMISGCLSPGESLFMDLNIPTYFNHYKKMWKRFRKNSFVNKEPTFFKLVESLCIVVCL